MTSWIVPLPMTPLPQTPAKPTPRKTPRKAKAQSVSSAKKPIVVADQPRPLVLVETQSEAGLQLPEPIPRSSNSTVVVKSENNPLPFNVPQTNTSKRFACSNCMQMLVARSDLKPPATLLFTARNLSSATSAVQLTRRHRFNIPCNHTIATDSAIVRISFLSRRAASNKTSIVIIGLGRITALAEQHATPATLSLSRPKKTKCGKGQDLIWKAQKVDDREAVLVIWTVLRAHVS